jgi:Lrp/AsnC family leucine-responsive transcriptional regulator
MLLDAVDRKLLSLLEEDSSAQYADLGKKLNLSPPAVHARVKKLEKEGVIEKFTIKVHPEAISKTVCAFIRLTMGDTANVETATYLRKFPEVEECHGVAGEDCMLLKVRVETPLALDALLAKIRKGPGFQRSITMMVLRSYFERGTSAEL